LGAPAFRAAWATGVALGLRGAVSEAIELTTRLPAAAAQGAGNPTWPGYAVEDAGLTPERLAEASGLTGREREVVGWISRGCTNREVAERMSVTVKAVEKHVSNVLAKLDLANRRQIAAWGHVHLPELGAAAGDPPADRPGSHQGRPTTSLGGPTDAGR
jgi:DNA-binding CsgD family transcriptional regulator